MISLELSWTLPGDSSSFLVSFYEGLDCSELCSMSPESLSTCKIMLLLLLKIHYVRVFDVVGVSFWARIRSTGRSLIGSWAMLGRFAAVLGWHWAVLGRSLALVGRSSGALKAFLNMFGGALWGALVSFVAGHWLSRGCIWSYLGALGAFLGIIG